MSDFQSAELNELTRLTAKIVSSYVAHQSLPAGELSGLIRTVYRGLAEIGQAPAEEILDLRPAVSIRRSVTPDYIVCLEDGKKLKMLKRHLRSTYNMTPEEYRAKWGLPADYPMVAPNYAAQRSNFAKEIGLGRGARTRRKAKRA